MTYFIGIAGTHSTGKSTFLATLKQRATERGITVETIADTATRCQSAGFKVLLDHTFESTLWILCSVIRAELEAALRADLVLVDRPVPDALGYLEAALEMTGRVISEKERAYLYELTKLHTPRYSLLFKTELDTSIPLGEGRDTNFEFRASAGNWISRTLETLGVQALDPHDPSAAMAVDSILSTIIESQGGNVVDNGRQAQPVRNT